MQSKKKYNLIIAILILIILIFFLFSIFIGSDGFNLNTDENIINYRFLRILLSFIAGSSLAISGASLQGIFNNHLADPHLLGISATAALAACINIAFFNYNFLFTIFFSIIGSLIILIFIFYNKNITTNLLVIGFIINSLVSSIISTLKIIIPAQKSQNMLFWLMGQINIINNYHFIISIIIYLLGLIILIKYKSQLEIISFGEEEAYLLGINSSYVIKITIFANCLLIANVVIFGGIIGFIGLVIPNFIRLYKYFDLRLLLPLSALGGGLCLMSFDTLSRLSFYFFATEIPTGSLCSLLLSPIFIWLFLRTKNASKY